MEIASRVGLFKVPRSSGVAKVSPARRGDRLPRHSGAAAYLHSHRTPTPPRAFALSPHRLHVPPRSPLPIAARGVRQPTPYRDAAPPDRRARARPVGRMTLEEKFWQLFMIPGDLDNPAHDYSHGVFGLQISTRRRRADQPARRARARRAHQRASSATSSSRRGSAFRSSRSRKRCTASRAKARRCSRRRSRSPRRGTPRSWRRVAARDRARDAQPRHSPGALAGDQHRQRRALGTRRGDVRRGSVPVVGHGRARSSRAFERAGIVDDAEAFRRQRRRGRTRQLSDRRQRARCSTERTSRRSSAAMRTARRALGDDGVQLGRRLAGDAEPAAAQRHAEARLGIHRLRHLRRRGHRRRDRAAQDRGEHGDGGEARVRRRPRRRLPVVVASSIGRISTRFSAD